eukprot:2739927-Amphidinium_carterae.3
MSGELQDSLKDCPQQRHETRTCGLAALSCWSTLITQTVTCCRPCRAPFAESAMNSKTLRIEGHVKHFLQAMAPSTPTHSTLCKCCQRSCKTNQAKTYTIIKLKQDAIATQTATPLSTNIKPEAAQTTFSPCISRTRMKPT